MNKQEYLKRMYGSVDKMNQFYLQGNRENIIREYIHQKQIRKNFEEADDD